MVSEITTDNETDGGPTCTKVNRRPKVDQKSLSTITEEPRSFNTSYSQSDSMYHFPSESNEEEGQSSQISAKKPLPPPKLPEPLPIREKKHTSAILRGTSKETVVDHNRSRTESWQQNLLAHLQMSGKPLFPTVAADKTARTPTMLVSGFGLRNIASLQEALYQEQHYRLQQIYKAQEKQREQQEQEEEQQDQYSLPSILRSSSTSIATTDKKSESSMETQTDRDIPKYEPPMCSHKKKLLRLMGVLDEEEEEEYDLSKSKEDVVEEYEESLAPATVIPPVISSKAMRQAQKYLRIHKIFEFFQFMIAHLLSALPDNPIDFIIDLLDKCLIFRAGLQEPPVLYNRKHLGVLFHLMDRMHTDYIDMDQYRAGMRTVGISSFNKNPPLTKDGMVSKECFIEEAYDCLTHLLSDMVKRQSLSGADPSASPLAPHGSYITTTQTTATLCNDGQSVHFAKTNIFFDNMNTP